MCKRTIGVLQELGRACRFLGISRLGPPGDQLQARAAHSSARERNERVQPRYRQAKATKRGGRSNRQSWRLGSTDEAGERVPPGARGGKRGVGSWNRS